MNIEVSQSYTPKVTVAIGNEKKHRFLPIFPNLLITDNQLTKPTLTPFSIESNYPSILEISLTCKTSPTEIIVNKYSIKNIKATRLDNDIIRFRIPSLEFPANAIEYSLTEDFTSDSFLSGKIRHLNITFLDKEYNLHYYKYPVMILNGHELLNKHSRYISAIESINEFVSILKLQKPTKIDRPGDNELTCNPFHQVSEKSNKRARLDPDNSESIIKKAKTSSNEKDLEKSEKTIERLASSNKNRVEIIIIDDSSSEEQEMETCSEEESSSWLNLDLDLDLDISV